MAKAITKKVETDPVEALVVKPRFFLRQALVIGGVILLVIVVVLGAVETKYRERIFPGVKVGDTTIGDMSADQARSELEKRFATIQDVQLVNGVNKWSVPASEIELQYFPDQIIDEAMAIGRNNGLVTDWRIRLATAQKTAGVEPVYRFSQERLKAFVATVAAQVNIPAIEPEITYETATKTIHVTSGANGQEIDERQLQQNLQAAFRTLDTTAVTLPITQLKPQLTETQVQTTRQRAGQLVGKTLTITGTENGQKWEVGTEDLFRWIDPTRNDGWKQDLISSWVAELAKTVDRQPENASFHVEESGRVTEFKPAKDGLVVRQPVMVEQILGALQKLSGESQTLTLQLVSTSPAVGNGDANNLGITELLAKGESWFTGSITNRIFNIQKAAGLLNGVLVPPGQTFSFNKTVGEISQATGFKTAFIIKEGKTLLGDGGGVCQVSSTLFRAVLNAGLPINERTAHAYRVSYYEQNYQPGFDATIFQPSPDFKFTNDTPAHILIQTEFDEKAKKLTFSLYGTSDGRKAEVSKSRIWEVIPAPPDLYIDDPTLAVGQVTQTEHKANGAKVAFDWKVTRGDEVLQERTFYSNYKAWQAVYLRGTKVN